jgi:hypothetical protein
MLACVIPNVSANCATLAPARASSTTYRRTSTGYLLGIRSSSLPPEDSRNPAPPNPGQIEIAIIAFLAGVVLLLVPRQWTVVKGLPAVISGVALCVELWWTAANKFTRLRHPALGPRQEAAPVKRAGGAEG